MGYKSDRAFTDYVHNNLAIDKIYGQLNWTPQLLNKNVTNNVDLTNAVDYFLIDNNNNKIITVQERFRESQYQTYTDFTIRFEREYNPNENRRLSEYYKLSADYFVYGIINKSKFDVEKATDFIKFAVIDIVALKELMDTGKIVVNRSLSGLKCKVIDGVLNCPVNYNRDRSSSFFPVDIKLLADLLPNENVIVLQRGF